MAKRRTLNTSERHFLVWFFLITGACLPNCWKLKKKKIKSDSHKNTPLETFWKQCRQISVVYITFEKHTLGGSYINTRDESHFEFEIPHSVQHLFTHPKPKFLFHNSDNTSRFIAAMFFLSEHALAAGRDAFIQRKLARSLPSTWHFRHLTVQGAGSRWSSTTIRIFSFGIMREDAKKCNLFVCLFVCLFVLSRTSNFSAIWQLCHHYRWRGCKFKPMLSTYSF
jgi:hypothetical protein